MCQQLQMSSLGSVLIGLPVFRPNVSTLVLSLPGWPFCSQDLSRLVCGTFCWYSGISWSVSDWNAPSGCFYQRTKLKAKSPLALTLGLPSQPMLVILPFDRGEQHNTRVGRAKSFRTELDQPTPIANTLRGSECLTLAQCWVWGKHGSILHLETSGLCSPH